MFVFKAAVVGAGTMGGEIAQVIANADIPVVLKDVDERFVEQGLDKARSLWQARVDAGKLTAEEHERKLALIAGTTQYDSFGDVDFVIEAVPERIEIKQSVFAELDEVTPGHAILASNTSSLSVTEMAQATGRPDKVVGFHFFYPASVMRLIEVIEGEDTSPETAQAAVSFAQAIRKAPIRCGEAPGFVVNRILIPVLNDAVRVLDEGVASPEDIDKGMRLGTNWPIGPLALIDLIGIDTYVHVCEALWKSIREERFAPPPTLVQMLDEGRLGRKSGRGFFEYAAAA